jgi:DNA-binding MarR family transcriptional regulator
MQLTGEPLGSGAEGSVKPGPVEPGPVEPGPVEPGLADQVAVADQGAVDAVLTASRTLIAVATRSLGAAAEDTTIAQYRALVVLASRGPQRLVDLSAALGVTPSTAGRMCDRLLRKGLIRRHRARTDRRAVQVSITAAGRQVVDSATARRRGLIADILGKLPLPEQKGIAAALRSFAEAAGEIPDSEWPSLTGTREQPARTSAEGRP